MSSPAWILAAAVFVAGVAARVAACFTDFWLDEVWTYVLLEDMDSPLDVLTSIHHSNNHHLNTLFFYLVGPDVSHWAVYRLPSLVMGIGSVVLAACICRLQSARAAWAAVVLTSTSYYLVYHASEARGYAGAMFFSLAAFWFLRQFAESRSLAPGLAFGCSVVLGFLSHLQFLHFYAGAGIWSFVHFLRHRHRVSVLASMVRLHGVALTGVAALYLVDVREMTIGGGPPYELLDVLSSTASLAVGTPRWAGPAALAVIVLGAAIALWRAVRRGDDVWVFHLLVIFVSPAVVLVAMTPDVLFERYFMVGHAFLLLLASGLFADAWASGTAGRLVASLALAGTVAGNAAYCADYLRYGRGTYLDALEYVVEHTDGDRVRVGSDHDFRNAMLIRFYERFLPGDESVVYVPRHRWHDRADWIILHSRTSTRPDTDHLQVGDRRFVHERSFPHGAHSGWSWFLFRPAP